MSPSNKTRSNPSITQKLAKMGVTASERVDKPNRGKLFLGTADNQAKLVRLSGVAREQLTREVIIPPVDYDAGRLVLEYINENDVHNPKPLGLSSLSPHAPLSFACKVYHACNAFRIPRDLRGNEVREYILFSIRGLKNVTLVDFQSVCESVHFDPGLMRVIFNKVAYHIMKKRISEYELSCIWEYVNLPSTAHLSLVGKIEEVWQEVWDRASNDEQFAFREEHGLQIVVVHQIVAGAPLVLSPGPKKPVLKINTGTQSGRKVAESVDQRRPSDSSDNSSTTIAAEKEVGTTKAAPSLANVKAAPSLAQAKATAQQKTAESKKVVAPAEKKPAGVFSYAKALGNNSGA
jgi:hypothetical protein